RIERIEIAGQIFGTPGATRPDDRFGFVAEEIGTLKVGAQTFNLNSGPNNDGILLGLQTATFFSDTALHEIGATIGSTSPLVAAAQLVNANTLIYTDIDGHRG